MEIEVPETGSPEKKSLLNSFVAVTVVVLSVCMALGKIKDDNIVQAMQVAKANSLDTWNEYQAKKLKGYIEEQGLTQAKLASAQADAAKAQQIAPMIAQFEAKIAKLGKDGEALMAKAKGFEKEYDDLGYRDDQFDLSDALLSIAMAVAAMAALTEKRWMLMLSWTFGVGGVIFGLAGFLGWALHPDGIIKILT
ncbi:protein of unknown function [Andreprevotia lacus DSM 23236]|jgi:ABC-type uncharacterized transport system substrate-binding protein|uniref:DUF4337 domain-containing protein n=1 Tax=Andreprevotia lacus DSM 23236 TaxID=1121001 RepID=A0A1W1XP86_9NEIS|nr:DUF4337 domain-containing protein [Andreprevotia lacus]SMC25687.1 protein of unknown function [Andreprevotia lacus DSM 23236]